MDKVLGIVLTLAFGYITYRLFKSHSMKPRKRMWLMILTGILTLSSLFGPYTSDSSKSTTSDKTQTSKSKRSSKADSSSSKSESISAAQKSSSEKSRSQSESASSQSKQAADSSSKAASSSESKVISDTRKKNNQQNYDKFLTDVKGIPATTNNTLTDAEYDADSGTLKLMLTDDALDLSDASLKSVVRAAWNAGNNLIQNDGPFSKADTPVSVTVYDSTGNVLAHSSMFGNFKYDAEK